MAKEKTFKREYKVVDVDSYEGFVGKYPEKSATFDDNDIIVVAPAKKLLNLKEGDIIVVIIKKK